jgi:outer membrane receptor protein involved in Fe transport
MRTAGPGQTEFEMRGLASSGGVAPTVGFYLDETPLSPAAASLNGKVVIDPDLFDLSRIEVLRGPQGTLYGSGSMGGTIKLITPLRQNALGVARALQSFRFNARVGACGPNSNQEYPGNGARFQVRHPL